MINKWSVLWKDTEGSHKRSFESDPPTPAVEFAKDLKRRGLNVDIISYRRAFAPPLRERPPDKPGVLWCPYCIKYREFIEAAIKDADGLLGPSILRCTHCHISIRDAYIRKFNRQFYERWETEQESKRAQRAQKQEGKKFTSVYKKPRRRN